MAPYRSATSGYSQGAGGASAGASGAASSSNKSTADMLAQYEIVERIGKGSFGVIHKIRRVSDGKIFARKEISFDRLPDKDRKQIVQEVNNLSTLTGHHHQHIVRYEERFLDRANSILYIVMEYCDGGDLGSVLLECRRQRKLLPEDTVLSYLCQIILGLDACHNAPVQSGDVRSSRVILHRDLKPDNIFLDGRQNIKIGDFGLSKEVAAHTFCSTYVGTPYYMCPEMARRAQYDVKSDIWALGCVAFEMCGLRPPFDATSMGDLEQKIQKGDIPELPRGYTRMLGELVHGMLSMDPARRPDTRTLLQHPLIRKAIAKREETLRPTGSRASSSAALRQREAALDEREATLNKREAELEEAAAHLHGREEQTQRAEEEVRVMLIELQVRQQAVKEREQVLQAAANGRPSMRAPHSMATVPTLDAEVPGMIPSASVQSLARDRSARREWSSTSEQSGTATNIPRRLAAARRGSSSAAMMPTPNRMHSSPCVVMGPGSVLAVDTSDVSMRDASLWNNKTTANVAPSSDDKENIISSSEAEQTVGGGRMQSTPLRTRRSSPHKLTSSARPTAGAASSPFCAATAMTNDESLPSPFLRKIVRTQSQPAAAAASSSPPRPLLRALNRNKTDTAVLSARDGGALSSLKKASPTFADSESEGDDGEEDGGLYERQQASGADDVQPRVSAARPSTAGASGAAAGSMRRLARQAIEANAAITVKLAAAAAAAATTTTRAPDFGSDDASGNSRRLSAMPRRRQSVLPGSVGVAPLGRKSGEAIRA